MSTITIAQSNRKNFQKALSELKREFRKMSLLKGFNKLSVLSFATTVFFVLYMPVAVSGIFNISSRTIMMMAVLAPATILISAGLSLRQISVTGEKGSALSIASIGALALCLVLGLAILVGLVSAFIIFG